jgi:hypothetical protein
VGQGHKCLAFPPPQHLTHTWVMLRIVLIQRIGDSERMLASVLLVLSICGESENRNNVGKDLVERSESKSEMQKSEVGGHRVRGSGCRNVGGRLRREEN